LNALQKRINIFNRLVLIFAEDEWNASCLDLFSGIDLLPQRQEERRRALTCCCCCGVRQLSAPSNTFHDPTRVKETIGIVGKRCYWYRERPAMKHIATK
jgi:hypothetical protein